MYSTSRILSFSLLFLGVLLSLPEKIDAQVTSNSEEDILTQAKAIYRADDRLLNGKYYKPKHFFAEGHPYFEKDEWEEGTLYIKGIQYNNIPIKYNIEDDKIIIKFISENRISKDILLHNSFVDSLNLGHHTFHNTSNFSFNNSIGFAELIYDGKINAYIKHSKKFKDELTERNPHGKYIEPKKKLYLFADSSYTPIRSRKELMVYFKPHEKELKPFLRKNRINFKKASSLQIVKLIQFCEQL